MHIIASVLSFWSDKYNKSSVRGYVTLISRENGIRISNRISSEAVDIHLIEIGKVAIYILVLYTVPEYLDEIYSLLQCFNTVEFGHK